VWSIGDWIWLNLEKGIGRWGGGVVKLIKRYVDY
jgi:hypothetical protein